MGRERGGHLSGRMCYAWNEQLVAKEGMVWSVLEPGYCFSQNLILCSFFVFPFTLLFLSSSFLFLFLILDKIVS